MMPEPTTAASSIAVPTPSETRRRLNVALMRSRQRLPHHRGRCRARRLEFNRGPNRVGNVRAGDLLEPELGKKALGGGGEEIRRLNIASLRDIQGCLGQPMAQTLTLNERMDDDRAQ